MAQISVWIVSYQTVFLMSKYRVYEVLKNIHQLRQWWLEQGLPHQIRQRSNDSSFLGCYFLPFWSYLWQPGLICYVPWTMNVGHSVTIQKRATIAFFKAKSEQSKWKIWSFFISSFPNRKHIFKIISTSNNNLLEN